MPEPSGDALNCAFSAGYMYFAYLARVLPEADMKPGLWRSRVGRR
jgi:hypothetical protein